MSSFILSADDIVRAFIFSTVKGKNADADDAMSHVSFRLRGAPNGYVRVWGPNSDPTKRGTSFIAIERYNGAIAFRHEGLAQRLEAKPRAQQRIEHDPLGWSAGPGGGFDWGLTPGEIAKRFDDADALVRAIVDAFAQEGIPW